MGALAPANRPGDWKILPKIPEKTFEKTLDKSGDLWYYNHVKGRDNSNAE